MKLLPSILVLMTVLSISNITHAQTQRSGSDSARVMQQMQQVTAEKNRLQSENEALKKENESLKIKNSDAENELKKLRSINAQKDLEVSKNQVNLADKDQAIEKTKAQLQELLVQYRDTIGVLRKTEGELNSKNTQLTSVNNALSACVDKNKNYFMLSSELIDKLEKQGFWSAVLKKESFTQLSRTRLENLADDTNNRINDLRVEQSSQGLEVDR